MKRILIFSNGEKIGDGIIKLPLIREIFNNYSEYEITWLTYGNTVYSHTLKNLSSKFINKVISNSQLSILPWKKISSIYDFENEFYDIIIDTQKTVLKTLSLKRIKSKIFISATASWLFSDLKLDKIDNKDKYYVEKLYDLIGLPLNKKLVYQSSFFFDKNLMKILNKIFINKKNCIGIAPGSGENNKKWNINNYIEISKHFEKLGYQMVYFVGPDDKFEKQKILEVFPDAFFPEDLINDFTGPEVVMASTNFLLCSLANDSGVSHMLSTNVSPLIKLFAEKNPIKFTPPNTLIETISAKKFQSNDINKIPVNYVIKKIENFLTS